LDPYLRLSHIESHPLDFSDKVFVADGNIETSHILSPVSVTNNAVYNEGIEPAPHCVRQPCVPEVMDAGHKAGLTIWIIHTKPGDLLPPQKENVLYV
jgi:hypothetical protein